MEALGALEEGVALPDIPATADDEENEDEDVHVALMKPFSCKNVSSEPGQKEEQTHVIIFLGI
jgi:hypothetical protein